MPGNFRFLRVFQIIGCIALAVPASAASHGTLLEKQRAAFVAVYPQAELGNWSPAESNQDLLADYVLWPDLRAMYLKSRVNSRHFDAADETAVLDYLEKYGSLRPARGLRYEYALKLAASGRLDDFLAVYQRYYQGQDIAKLDCLALQADIRGGKADRIVNRAIALWLVGTSQAEQCDPVFEYLQQNGLLSNDLYRARYALAVKAREFGLARYLSSSLEARYKTEATNWIQARDNPLAFVAARTTRPDTPTHREQLLYALEQIAYKQPEEASVAWRQLKPAYAFSDAQIAATSQHIALWLARRQSPFAYAELVDLPPEAVNTEVRRWMARTSLRRHDWNSLIDSVAAMPADEQQQEEWRYWHASALRGIAQEDHALSLMHELSGERSYYGFLAADDLGIDYAFTHTAAETDENAIARLESNPAIIRARELFFVGLESNGRSEWDTIVGAMSAGEKLQAALLAHRWGWHSRAISAAASAGEYNDLDIRFPLAYEESFERYSADAGISPSWAYGVARSESLFMSDVRSSAGAVGVMQLMPATGRQTAQEIKLPYAGMITLVDPGSNIRLGTTYLGKMLERFDRNPVLATAAYNAGPSNVESWLPAADSVDARIWIENIPYNETRRYVRRVLVTDAIFYWRMTGKTRRISSGLPAIAAANASGRIVSKN
jgi:soluble lytic murein transglycosylase